MSAMDFTALSNALHGTSGLPRVAAVYSDSNGTTASINIVKGATDHQYMDESGLRVLTGVVQFSVQQSALVDGTTTLTPERGAQIGTANGTFDVIDWDEDQQSLDWVINARKVG